MKVGVAEGVLQEGWADFAARGEGALEIAVFGGEGAREGVDEHDSGAVVPGADEFQAAGAR